MRAKVYFPALTGIRAIAAFMVFIHHYNPFHAFGDYVFNFFGEFYVGVNFFFVLSGFLITYRYYETPSGSFSKYFINRFARVYPIYFILTTLTFMVLVSGPEGSMDELKAYILNITFLKGLFNDFKFTGIAQAWTLTVEEMFYFSAPLIYLWIKRSSWLSLLIIPACLIIVGVGVVSILRNVHFHGFFESFQFMMIYTFFGRAFEFFVGITLALVFMNYRTRFRGRHFTMVGMVIIFICILTLSWIKGGLNYAIDHPLGIVVSHFVLPFFGIGLFYWGLLNEKTFVSNLLSSKFFRILGNSSYTFYLIHVGVMSSFLMDVSPNPIFLFIALNVLAILIYKYIEQPINLRLRRTA